MNRIYQGYKKKDKRFLIILSVLEISIYVLNIRGLANFQINNSAEEKTLHCQKKIFRFRLSLLKGDYHRAKGALLSLLHHQSRRTHTQTHTYICICNDDFSDFIILPQFVNFRSHKQRASATRKPTICSGRKNTHTHTHSIMYLHML